MWPPQIEQIFIEIMLDEQLKVSLLQFGNQLRKF